MQFQELLVNVFERIAQVLEKALDGLTEYDLTYQPSPGCNSIAWLAWHLTRVQDSAISSLMHKEQCWIADKWYIKFGSKADPNNTGVGDSPEDVSNFKAPDAKTILDYHYAVFERSREYIGNLTTVELGRELDSPRSPLVGLRIAGIINDNFQHVGQIAYIRGMAKGQGWYGV